MVGRQKECGLREKSGGRAATTASPTFVVLYTRSAVASVETVTVCFLRRLRSITRVKALLTKPVNPTVRMARQGSGWGGWKRQTIIWVKGLGESYAEQYVRIPVPVLTKFAGSWFQSPLPFRLAISCFSDREQVRQDDPETDELVSWEQSRWRRRRHHHHFIL